VTRAGPPLLLLALLGGGCAGSGAVKMSFADAGLAGRPTPAPGPARGAAAARVAASAGAEAAPADTAFAEDEHEPTPPVATPAPESIAAEAPSGPPIDAVLLRFAAEARDRRGRLPPGRGFPAEASAAWTALAAELDGYLARALPETPLLELVRARVTVEAEWDYDERRFGPAPAPIRALVGSRAERFGRRIDTARALGMGLFARVAPPRLRWPIEDAGISSLFGMRRHPLDGRRRMHHGVDFASGTGRVVAAAGEGYVVRAGWMGGYGLVVEIRHPGDLTTRYGHLSALLCAPGDAVDPGQPLGLVGRTGRATGPHLHFEVWRGGEPADPLPFLDSTRSVAARAPAPTLRRAPPVAPSPGASAATAIPAAVPAIGPRALDKRPRA
jgi:murein DD-endopeptidase MepM/ murein hydrolase activator NlpD